MFTHSSCSCYKVDKTHGLTSLPNTLRYLGFNQTTPAFGPPNTLSDILFSSDDKRLLASYKGNATVPGYILSWDVATDGSLSKGFTKVPLPKGGLAGFGMVNIASHADAIVNVDPGVGLEVVDLSGKSAGSTLTFNGEMASCWSSYSSVTKNYYATDAGAAVVREVSVDSSLNAKFVAVRGPLVCAGSVVANLGLGAWPG